VCVVSCQKVIDHLLDLYIYLAHTHTQTLPHTLTHSQNGKSILSSLSIVFFSSALSCVCVCVCVGRLFITHCLRKNTHGCARTHTEHKPKSVLVAAQRNQLECRFSNLVLRFNRVIHVNQCINTLRCLPHCALPYLDPPHIST
jgi:hypothetical protein